MRIGGRNTIASIQDSFNPLLKVEYRIVRLEIAWKPPAGNEICSQ
jgi:hypothetical protein